MARQFEAKGAQSDSITLRDFLAMMMPKPPGIESSSEPVKLFMNEMKERYSMADRIIRDVR